ncbi:MAG: tRNA (guanosine(46)-N7)-methyltransferase TrmB [Hyphomicrobiales bacterium]|nr:MAG: tRNA (guanosine(46)-N7)-methyltransferase TrmB [Hyphomicrobiales bacterium]
MTGPDRNDDHPAYLPESGPWRNFYGRRHGKTLRKGQKALLETRLTELAPPGVSWAENPDRNPIDPGALFPDAREVWLEIGFGAGEHMLHMAAANPDIGIIGCEAYVNGVAMLLSGIKRAGVANLAIHPGDARDLMDVLPAGSVGQVFLLYPDPWPKKRHYKRRFINPENLDQLARIMAAGSILRLATDIGDYARHALELIDRDPRFTWLARGPADWRESWPGWSGTRYEAKALREGRMPQYLSFQRS